MQEHIIYFQSIKQSEIANIYKMCDMFIFPSKYEIFGMVLLEAMNFGLPVISSYNGGSSTIIENEINGMIVNNFDVNEWAYTIKKVLEDTDLQKKLRLNAQRTASKDFGWENITKKILDRLDI